MERTSKGGPPFITTLATHDMRSVFLTLNAAVLVAGCATGPLDATDTFLPPIHNERLAQAKICCSSYREMPFVKLALGQESAGALTAESPVYAFGEGRSFFAAFELPANVKRLEVKTYPRKYALQPGGARLGSCCAVPQC
jgi:hypothetical protein